MIVLRHKATATRPARRRRTTPRTALPFVLLAGAFIYDRQPLAHAGEANVCEREMTQAAKRYDVPLAVLYAASA